MKGPVSRIWIANAINDSHEMFKDVSDPFVAFEVSQTDYDNYRDNKICLLTLQKSAIGKPLLFDFDKITEDEKILDAREVEPLDHFYPERVFLHVMKQRMSLLKNIIVIKLNNPYLRFSI